MFLSLTHLSLHALYREKDEALLYLIYLTCRLGDQTERKVIIVQSGLMMRFSQNQLEERRVREEMMVVTV